MDNAPEPGTARDVFEYVRADRLVLRRMRPEDAEDFLLVHLDPLANRHSPTGPPSPTECEALFEMFLSDWTKHSIGYWAVEVQGRIAGFAGVRKTRLQDHPVLNLYYRFAVAAWGCGYATQASRHAVELGSRLLPRTAIVAKTRPTNAAAIAVATRAGLLRRPELDRDGFVVFATRWSTRAQPHR